MSHIITLHDHRQPRPTKGQQADALMKDVREVAQIAAARVCVEATGPMAQILAELMDRQAALEDHCGFTYVPKATAEAPVVPDSSGGDTEPADSIASGGDE